MNGQVQPNFRTAERRLPFECGALVSKGGGVVGKGRPNKGLAVQPVPAVLKGATCFSLVYNLFRHRLAPDLFCAVPEDCPVPTFIEATNWTFAGTTDALAQGAFDPEATRTVVRFNRFYLFVTLNRRSRRHSPVRTTPRIVDRLRTAPRIRSAAAAIAP